MASRYIRRLTALVVPAVLLMANGATAGAALEVGPVGGIVADGAGVGIPVTVTCAPAGEGGVQNLFIQVRQAVGEVVASGIGFTEEFLCDGTPQKTLVPVFADPGSRPFRAGEAVVQASLAVCTAMPEPVPLPSEAQPTDVMPPPPGPGPAPVPVEPGPVPPAGGEGPCQLATMSSVIFLHPADMPHHTPMP